jgi:hypothetical protein
MKLRTFFFVAIAEVLRTSLAWLPVRVWRPHSVRRSHLSMQHFGKPSAAFAVQL